MTLIDVVKKAYQLRECYKIADPQWLGIYSARLNGILDRTIHNICLQIGHDKRACSD